MLNSIFHIFLTTNTYILRAKFKAQISSAQVGVRVDPVLTRNDCIKRCISVFVGIIYQQLDAFQTEIQGSLIKLCAFKVSWGHPSNVAKLLIMTPGAENMEYLNHPRLHCECIIAV